MPEPLHHPPDEITREVIELVNRRFNDHPGSLDEFAWPVTRTQALATLQRFIDERLPQFGRWQDAMWTGEPWLWHAHVSSSLNLKLLNPREVIAAAEAAYRDGRVPIESAEGFIRQILGWREFVRGIYWLEMPDYLERNALGANEDLPAWYWTGATDMACLADAIGQTLRLGYAHHIQRLMVTGLFALLYGAQPRQVHEWYLAVYVDAVEWVELPNTLGMSQYGDGGLMGSKPYVATGKYIQRMSNHCAGCRYDPAKATGDDACPFTTLYWDFLVAPPAALRRPSAHEAAGGEPGRGAAKMSWARSRSARRRSGAGRSGRIEAYVGGASAPMRSPKARYRRRSAHTRSCSSMNPAKNPPAPDAHRAAAHARRTGRAAPPPAPHAPDRCRAASKMSGPFFRSGLNTFS